MEKLLDRSVMDKEEINILYMIALCGGMKKDYSKQLAVMVKS